MDFRRLQYFVAVAEHLNFTAAARQLGMAQPPLSTQIRKLESEVGGPLFHREGKVRLTPLGMLFLDEARVLLDSAAQLNRRVQDAAAGRDGEIRIAFTPGARSERVARRIRKFQRKSRGVRIVMSDANPTDEGILRHVDVLFSEDLDYNNDIVVVDRAKIRIAVPPKHRLADRPELTPIDLVGETLWTSPFPKRSLAERIVTELLRKTGAPSEELSCDSTHRFWRVSCGLGLAVCTDADRDLFDAISLPFAPRRELLIVASPSPTSRAAALPLFLEAIRESRDSAPPTRSED